MAIVMVCTSDKLHESISVIDNKFRHGDSLPRYIAPVLIDFFLESDSSKSLLTRPGGKIYSCTLDKLISAFRDNLLSIRMFLLLDRIGTKHNYTNNNRFEHLNMFETSWNHHQHNNR